MSAHPAVGMLELVYWGIGALFAGGIVGVKGWDWLGFAFVAGLLWPVAGSMILGYYIGRRFRKSEA